MGTTTPFIGLYIPAAGETNYNDSFAQGMLNLDAHDHTGGPNKGVPITSSALAPFSVTFDKLNSNVADVTTGIGTDSTPGLQNQLQILGILKNLFQLATANGFLGKNGANVVARTFQDTATTTWTNKDSTGGDPSVDVKLSGIFPVSVADGGTGVTSLTPFSPILGGTTPTNPVQQPALGNSGDVLTSQGAGFPSIFTPLGNLGQIKYASVNLTAAQFNTLGTIPVTLVAAPGAGKVLVPLFCYSYLNSSGVAFTNNVLAAMVGLYYNNSQQALLWNFQMFIGATTNLYSWAVMSQSQLSSSQGFPQADILNTPLILTTNTGTDHAGGGTSTVQFLLAYTVITLP